MDNNVNSAAAAVAAAAAITREVIYNIIKLYKKETPSPRCTPAHQDTRHSPAADYTMQYIRQCCRRLIGEVVQSRTLLIGPSPG